MSMSIEIRRHGFVMQSKLCPCYQFMASVHLRISSKSARSSYRQLLLLYRLIDKSRDIMTHDLKHTKAHRATRIDL